MAIGMKHSEFSGFPLTTVVIIFGRFIGSSVILSARHYPHFIAVPVPNTSECVLRGLSDQTFSVRTCPCLLASSTINLAVHRKDNKHVVMYSLSSRAGPLRPPTDAHLLKFPAIAIPSEQSSVATTVCRAAVVVGHRLSISHGDDIDI